MTKLAILIITTAILLLVASAHLTAMPPTPPAITLTSTRTLKPRPTRLTVTVVGPQRWEAWLPVVMRGWEGSWWPTDE